MPQRKASTATALNPGVCTLNIRKECLSADDFNSMTPILFHWRFRLSSFVGHVFASWAHCWWSRQWASLDIRSWPMFLMDVPWRICPSFVSRKVCVLVSLLRLVVLCMCVDLCVFFRAVNWIDVHYELLGYSWEHVEPSKDVEKQTIIRLKAF